MRSVSKYSLKVNIISVQLRYLKYKEGRVCEECFKILSQGKYHLSSDISNTRRGEYVRSVSKYSLKVNIISAQISQIQGRESV